jgi:DNA repair exonuclease SbcCD ATPase subunit
LKKLFEGKSMTAPAALFEWMNTFPDVQALGASSLSDFRDGLAVALVWNAIAAPPIDASALARPRDSADWISCLKNLRAIDQVLSPTFAAHGYTDRPDITSIARKALPEDVARLVQPLLAVAVQCPMKAEILSRIKGLSVPTQKILKGLLEKSQPAAPDPAGDREIAAMRKQIEEYEAQLREREASGREAEQLRERLRKAQADQEKAQSEFDDAKRRYEEAVQNSRREATDTALKSNIIDQIKLIESALTEYKSVEDEVAEWRQKTKALEVEIGAMDEEIRRLKDEITTSVQLAERYGAPGLDDVVPAENEAKETVPELANRISQLEVEIAVLKDSLESGQTGIPAEVAREHEELKRATAKLLKRKKALEADAVKKHELRSEMQRVQKLMVDQREEVERELGKLADEINLRNIELTNWLSFSSSFDAWRQSSTFISELRQNYL